MLQAIWEGYVTALCYGVIIPAMQHPLETVGALTIGTALMIWRA